MKWAALAHHLPKPPNIQPPLRPPSHTMRAFNLFVVTLPQIRTTGFDLELICAVGYNPRQVKPKCDR
jgi:hypothetical protein